MASSSFFTSNPAPVETRDVDSILAEARVVAQGIIDSASNADEASQEAQDSATNAAQSAQAASNSASGASGSASNAALSASAASTSASTAQTAATNAGNSASAASTSASNAAQSATDANTYKQAALTAASNAGTSQAAAAQSETNAATSASQAAASVVGTVKYNQAQTLSSGEKTQARSNLGLATVASSGAYGDLSGKPTLATVATSGAYGDLSGKPSLGDAAAKNTGTTAGTLAAGDDSRIVASVTRPFGQCRVVFGSTTSIKLMPFGGNLLFVNGQNYSVPSTGVTITNASLAASTLYYVYAFVSGGNLALELSTTGHSTNTTYGNEQKTGDATRSLVGMVRTSAATLFVDSAAQRFVASWFARRNVIAANSLGSAISTTATTAIELNSSVLAEFLSWNDEAGQATITGTAAVGASASGVYTQVGLDGAVVGVPMGTVSSATFIVPAFASVYLTSLTEGYHHGDMFGYTTNGVSDTFQTGLRIDVSVRI